MNDDILFEKQRVDKATWCFGHNCATPCAECDGPCPACDGKGGQFAERCSRCRGTGLAGTNGKIWADWVAKQATMRGN